MSEQISIPEKQLAETSQYEANKVIRVLSGDKRLKYTVRVIMKSGRIYEFQAEKCPAPEWSSAIRAAVLELHVEGSYPSVFSCLISEVEFVYTESNP